MARLLLTDCPADPVGPIGEGPTIVDDALQDAGLALAAEQVGGAQRCLDVAVAYSKERTAFDRPIGSFQAIKHHCADVHVEIECARSAVWYAGWALQHDADDRASAGLIARSYATETYLRAARTCIQVLGGVGFTREHPAHLHFRRATCSSQLLGAPIEHREQLMATLVEPTPAGSER